LVGMSGGSMLVANKFMPSTLNQYNFIINKDVRFNNNDAVDIYKINKAADGTFKWQ
jgi:hypothetical protein